MMLSIQVTKFKFPQYQPRAISPNLMLTKVTSYMVIFNGHYFGAHINATTSEH